MPPRRIGPQEWKNFTGVGFYRYQQKLKAVGEWSNPGSSGSSEEVMQRVEDPEERGRGRIREMQKEGTL